MLDSLLQIVAPHHCYGCDNVGTLLCDNCKYDITQEPFSGCIACLKPNKTGVCSECRTPYRDAWSVGERSEVLESLIDGFKFERVKEVHKTLAELLDSVIPALGTDVVVVPIPTVASHMRVRGYDHAHLVAKQLAKRRGWQLSPLLGRRTTTKQRGTSRKVRLAQAREAFSCRTTLDSTKHYLLVDDVFTTGATMYYGAKVLCAQSAKNVSIAVIARQPFDDHRKI